MGSQPPGSPFANFSSDRLNGSHVGRLCSRFKALYISIPSTYYLDSIPMRMTDCTWTLDFCASSSAGFIATTLHLLVCVKTVKEKEKEAEQRAELGSQMP